MNNDVYQPPKADLKTHEAPSGSLLKGVLFGSLTDIIGTIVFGLIVGIAYGVVVLASRGSSEQEIMAQAVDIGLTSPLGLINIVGGLLISFLAGYLCAMKSGEHVMKATIIVCLISSIFALTLGYDRHSIVENMVLITATIMAILVGSKVWQSKNA